MNRYTTIIDISGAPCYRSVSVRLLYLHLCLKAGYHKEDMDVVHSSLVQLATGTGLTVSAVRHALGQLESAGLVSREGSALRVVKFVQPVLAAKRSVSAIVDGSKEENDRQNRISYLEEEIDKLRRWWNESKERGDTESCGAIEKEAAKLKRELSKLRPV